MNQSYPPPTSPTIPKPILQVEGLVIHYETPRGAVQAVSDVSFSVQPRERFGLVGESGCGKSTLVTAFLRMTKPPGVIKAGRILLNGVDILALPKNEMRRVRWSQVALIPQGAMNSLNPVMRVRDQIADALVAHGVILNQAALTARIEELLARVELPARVARLYPHELSGGMKQRVCIAMATALEPKLIIADEPTSALDVVTQRAVMEMLANVQEMVGAALILIGHDMGLMAQVVDRLGVMYAGELVEVGDVTSMFKSPQHPYTRALLGSLPSPRERKVRRAIGGLPPALIAPPPGCRFHPRCPEAIVACREVAPRRLETTGGWATCHLLDPTQASQPLEAADAAPSA